MSVYVRWYGEVLQGEVVENRRTDSLGDMVAVRIKIQGANATALFTPQHVYASPELIKGNSPIISQSAPKVSENPREISRNEKLSPVAAHVTGISALEGILEAFKAEHWDHEHGHLRIDALDEFYQLRRAVKSGRAVAPKPVIPVSAEAPEIKAVLPMAPAQLPVRSETVKKKSLMRCWKCQHLDYDHISDCQEQPQPGEHFCGLHGRTRVDPDGEQMDLDHHGGCGFSPRKQAVQLSLFV